MKYTSNDPEFETYMLEVRHDAGQLCIVDEKEDIQRELELELDKTKIRAKRKDGAEHLESADKTLLPVRYTASKYAPSGNLILKSLPFGKDLKR